ncbi:MAG: sugar phosphate isomerase/epimerase [Planctomycetes bacterium]|nr:sugar phosphate isomerase/epimerase [Planctomycetota bacterium]
MGNCDENRERLHYPSLGRRELLACTAAFGATFLARQGLLASESADEPKPGALRGPTDRRPAPFKKSINMWAFPYPASMTLKECFALAKDAGFDGIEINFDLRGEFSAESTDRDLAAVGELARETGLPISGVCSFLFWPFPLTHPDRERRETALQLTRKMIRAAKLVGTDNLLVVPGAADAAWVDDFVPVPGDVCRQRACEAVRQLLPEAAEAGVYLNIENIFVNGFLFSPEETVAFVDSFQHPNCRIHFDTGNILQYQYPEFWIPILGKRIQNIHFKEWDKRTHEFNLHCFRPLLDGTTNWPAVVDALDKIGYRGYVTFEYFHPYTHYPEALIYQTSDAMDRILGRTPA